MKLCHLLLLVLINTSLISLAQKKTATTAVAPVKKVPAAISCDCKNPIRLVVQKTTLYGPTVAPISFGEAQEITSTGKGDKFNFEKEHNSSWYLLTMNYEGELVFEIIPTDSSNDYDFLLYKYTDSTFCKQLQKRQMKPVRSNISRNDSELKGLTGLSADAKNEYTAQGIHDSWSKSIEVKKGEKYMLVLDNVYPNGMGHTLKFNFVKNIEISGTVINNDSLPISKAEVALEDSKGNLVKQILANKDGKYAFKAALNDGENYFLTFSADSSFIDTRIVNTQQLVRNSNSFTDIRTQLSKLKKGEKYVVKNINFVGGTDVLIKESYPSVYALTKLMKKNKNMKIRIEGHVNGAGGKAGDPSFQILSEQRALMVHNILTSKGVEKERLQTIGFGDKKMIYRFPKNEIEALKNRRVEINVLSID